MVSDAKLRLTSALRELSELASRRAEERPAEKSTYELIAKNASERLETLIREDFEGMGQGRGLGFGNGIGDISNDQQLFDFGRVIDAIFRSDLSFLNVRNGSKADSRVQSSNS